MAHGGAGAVWSRRDKGVVALAALAIIFDGFDNQVLGFAMPSLIAEWGVSKADLAIVPALGLLGMTLGSMMAGALGDRLGRRTMLIASVLLFGVMTLASGLVQGPAALAVMRFLAGLGMGGAMPNATAYAAEFTPLDRRPLAVNLTIVCIPVGGVVAGLIARTVLPELGWRALFFIAGGLPLLVGVLLLFALPETPSFKTVVRHGRFGELFTPAMRRDTLALWAAFFACLLAVYSALSWAPTMLTEAKFDPRTASDGLSAFNFGGIAGSVLAAWFIMRLGSRRTLLAMSGAGCLIALVTGLAVIGRGDAASAVAAFALIGFSVSGVQTTLFALAAHVYPDAIRATGVGAAVGIGRLGAVLSSFLGAAVLAMGGGAGYFGLIAVAIAGVFVALSLLTRHIPRPA